MGGQGAERREILKWIGMASVAAGFPGFRRWAFACSHGVENEAGFAQIGPMGEPAAGERVGHQGKDGYVPLFFSPEQFRMVEHLTDMIIPADDTPGAKEAGVAEFIDFMLANRASVSAPWDTRTTEELLRLGSEAQEQFITGLAWMNAHCKREFGRVFLGCAAEQQRSLLEALAYKAKFKPTTEEGRDFFQMVRDYTVVGYYTTKIGLESLGYPGLRVVWPAMPGCPHPDDPEHLHLKETV